MEIVKKINNNVALATDAAGNELIVFGKGVGFPAMPYTLTDMSVVQRTFYDVSHKYLALLADIHTDIILAADDIAAVARDELDCPLNPNLPFVLADHISFAIQNAQNGVSIHTPIAYDIEHLYPREYALGVKGRETIREKLKVDLPDSEVLSIALHLINAEAEVGDFHSTMITTQVISQISEMVERYFDITLDKAGFNYSRFAMHMRYLVQRMLKGAPQKDSSASAQMVTTLSRDYPNVYDCVSSMEAFLSREYGWRFTKEETLYLMMHTYRVQNERAEG